MVLHRIRRLGPLTPPAREIAVPHAVVAELEAMVPSDGALTALREFASVRLVPDVPVPGAVLAHGLGRGESQVLAHGASVPGTMAVLDDLAARKCAAGLRIPVIGTIGLVALARRRGVVTAARPVLAALVDAGLRVSPVLIRSVLAELGET